MPIRICYLGASSNCAALTLLGCDQCIQTQLCLSLRKHTPLNSNLTLVLIELEENM